MSRVQIITATATPPRPATLARAMVAVAAACLLTAAIFLMDGIYGRPSIALFGGALALILAAILLPDAVLRGLNCPSLLASTIILCLGIFFALAILRPPAAYNQFSVVLSDGNIQYPALYRLNLYWSLLAMSAVLAGTLFAKKTPLGPLTFPALILMQFVLSAWLIGSDPIPRIDVFAFQQTSMHALLSGHDPYATPMPNLYAGQFDFYGPGIENGTVLNVGFPYMPLALVVMLIGAIPDDVRYAMAASLTGAALLIGYSRPGRIAKLAAVGLLFMPRTLFVIDQSWNEPIVLLFLSLTIFCALRLPRLMPYALGLLMASKQYMPFAIVLLPLLIGWDYRRLFGTAIRAAATAVAVTLPWALAHPKGFFNSVVMMQIRQPFRSDSLSLLAAAHDLLGPRWQLPTSIGFVVILAAAALVLWCIRPSPAGFALAVALIYFAFFAFSKQAFMNYYFLVIGAIWCAVAATDLSEADLPPDLSLVSVASPQSADPIEPGI
jgi:hypothetical protein